MIRIALLAAFSVFAAPALAAPPACTMPAGWELHTTIKDLPQSIRDDLQNRTGGVADAGEPFSEGDVALAGQLMSRFIRAWKTSDHWTVGYERGGRAYGVYAFDYPITADGVGPGSPHAGPPALCLDVGK